MKKLQRILLMLIYNIRHPLYLIKRLRYKYLIKILPFRYRRIIKKLRYEDKIKVAFFAVHSSVWKYDYLYQLMVENPRFEPVIVVCPVVNFGMENMLNEMDKCHNMFKVKGYNVVRTYDKETDSYLDVRKEINPHIIFYTNPYQGLIDDRYYVTQFLDKLTCYVSYNFGNSNNFEMFHNQKLHNLVWRLYAETEEHKLYSQKYAGNKGKNIEVTGYPGIDKFIDRSYQYEDMWKIKDSSVKRIIWAPHHTIKENEVVYYSCFLKYYQFMFDVAEKYKDKIQIAFKPHPLLRVKLNSYWGKEETDKYYEKWDALPNCMFVDSDYVDLFLSSDAMIHDCGSFITEYLYTLSPVMRTDNDIEPSTEFNDFALECLSLHYHAKSEEEVEQFIINVINGEDKLKKKRMDFYNTKLMPPHKQLASENILENILENIN